METIGRVPTVEGSKPLLEYFGYFGKVTGSYPVYEGLVEWIHAMLT